MSAAPPDGVALLTLDRPPVNAFDAETFRAYTERLHALARDPAVRVVVLTGAGERAFHAGADTGKMLDPAAVEDELAGALTWFETLSAFPKPLVGALNGPAVGGGAAIAADCDVLVAVPTATISIPELSLGVVGGGSHIKRLAPTYFKAQRMMLLGEKLTAQEALAAGILAAIVEREELLPTAFELAARIAALPPEAVQTARAIFRRGEHEAVLPGYRSELDAIIDLG